jgi:hypothetical protein
MFKRSILTTRSSGRRSLPLAPPLSLIVMPKQKGGAGAWFRSTAKTGGGLRGPESLRVPNIPGEGKRQLHEGPWGCQGITSHCSRPLAHAGAAARALAAAAFV